MHRLLFFFTGLLFLNITGGLAQTQDSIYYQLQQINITPVSKETELRLLSSESILDKSDLEHHASSSLVPAMNTIQGVRMEERSPGSYRLSIRGSLLRSPFGVRNIKIYLGDFPFTDAGGNTYLNSLDISAIQSVRILKGPESSIFGANTGGVLLIDPTIKTSDSLNVQASLSAGSYGLFHEHAAIQSKGKTSTWSLQQSFQRSNGYRAHCNMQRQYVQATNAWNYHSKAHLKLLLLYSDLFYETPGGLTLSQFNTNPQQARPATISLPGAETQKASVYTKTVFGGISHDLVLTNHLRHVIAVFGSYTDFKNPFITNYETRREHTYGARTYLEFSAGNPQKTLLKWHLGGEWQRTQSNISNYGNQSGTKDTIQTADRLNAKQSFLFTRFILDFHQRLLVELSLSYNFFHYAYTTITPAYDPLPHQKKFHPAWMPRLAVSYPLTPLLCWRASASVGYSSPTLAEVRSSNQVINTDLQAETGQSYETGFRLRDRKDRLWIDISAFYFQLQQAIVRRTLDNGTDYFINAGGTRQPGLEAQMSFWIITPRSTSVIRALQVKGNLTYNQFTFRNYQVQSTDYSNHPLTGVPDYTTVESLNLDLPFHLSLYAQYYYSAAIPLTDESSVYSKPYHLVQLKTGWQKNYRNMNFIVFAGIDNLLNATYSLGNDLNAAGARYYNAAAPRNYYAGIKTVF